MMQVATDATQSLKKAASYAKFRRPSQLRVALMDGGYHLHLEAMRALEQLGHTVLRIKVSKTSSATNLTKLLEAIVSARPDFVLMINHIGLDAEGRIGALLDTLEMPVASWYCDSPVFVLRDGHIPAPIMSSIFVWERTLVDTMRQLGAQDVHHLPLGCDIDLFGPTSTTQTPTFDVSFVGDSMTEPLEIWSKRLPQEWHADAEEVRDTLSRQRVSLADVMLSRQKTAPHKPIWDILALGTFQATQRYRLEQIKELDRKKLTLFGDRGWRALVPGAHHRPPVHYGPALAQVYGQSKISLNATSLQMPTAVNQRVFDVPIAGGFVLSDNQDDLREFFSASEAIFYENPEDLRSKVTFYLRHQTERERISEAARSRILRQHTYRHRLDKLCRQMAVRHRRRVSFFPTVQGRESKIHANETSVSQEPLS